MPGPRVGEPAPDVRAVDSDGRPFSLTEHAGSYLVLYFYPRSFTPGCTLQACRFRDNRAELEALGAKILGVSLDEDATQRDFASKHALGFPLVGDADGAISKAYGVKRSLFKTAKRVTFIIDPEGKVAARFHHELQINKHLDDVVSFLRAREG